MRTPLWKSIKDFPNYSVSKYGEVSRVRHVRGGRSRYILKPIPDQGFVRYALYRNGKHHLVYANNLVAAAYLPEPQDERRLFKVIHIDGNLKNNFYRNLRYAYVRAGEKHAHAIWLGKQKERLLRDYRITI